MSRALTGRRSRKVGLAPGSVVYTGQRKVDRPTLDLMRYHPTGLSEERDLDLDEALARIEPGGVTWLNINGLHDPELITRVGHAFGLHPLTLEDVVSVGQRPKVEHFESYLYIVMRMLRARAATVEGGPVEGGPVEPHHNEQISMTLGRGFLITFQEQPGDVFEPVRERIRQGKGRIRTMGADYLAYALIDVIVDNYFVVLETYSEETEALEAAVFDDPTPTTLERVRKLKQETLFLRRAVWPVRDLMAQLLREETELLSPAVNTFLRDAYDHIVQAIDTVETLRDLLSGLQDAYLSTLSFRMNEVMKVLTIIATIFIPLSFLVGVYGMNFDVIPELHVRWAYPALWVVMLTVVAGMLGYFRRRGWL